MELGAFSVSLAVKDLEASRTFYTKLGFEVVGGDGNHYQILRNGTTLIGLFQGMFERNILTFNPGWDHAQNALENFTDVRALKKQTEASGLKVTQDTTGDAPAGPASFVLIDPDGNPVLIDQHR